MRAMALVWARMSFADRIGGERRRKEPEDNPLPSAEVIPMRLIPVVLLAALLPLLWQAVAHTQTSPGSGHGFLIDKHAAASVNCAACHRDAPPPNAPAMPACLGCHGSYSQIAAKTAAKQPNPHASHLGELPCAGCHHVHEASESLCDSCHAFGMNPP
jgi:fumarate reductase flavoprotein subunit